MHAAAVILQSWLDQRSQTGRGRPRSTWPRDAVPQGAASRSEISSLFTYLPLLIARMAGFFFQRLPCSLQSFTVAEERCRDPSRHPDPISLSSAGNRGSSRSVRPVIYMKLLRPQNDSIQAGVYELRWPDLGPPRCGETVQRGT